MEQRDLIKDEIEQLGRVLGQILAIFAGFKTRGQISQGIQATNLQLQSELDIDVNAILELEKEALAKYLESKKLSNSQLEELLDYLSEIAEHKQGSDDKKAKAIFEKCLEILDIVNRNSQTYSMSRNSKELIIKEKLLN